MYGAAVDFQVRTSKVPTLGSSPCMERSISVSFSPGAAGAATCTTCKPPPTDNLDVLRRVNILGAAVGAACRLMQGCEDALKKRGGGGVIDGEDTGKTHHQCQVGAMCPACTETKKCVDGDGIVVGL